jgi:hypothetical protein
MVEVQPGVSRCKFHPLPGVSGNERCFVRHVLSMPVHALRCAGLIVDINNYTPSNSRSQQRAGKLSIVSGGCDAVTRRQFNLCLADMQRVGWIAVADFACHGACERCEPCPGRRPTRMLEKRPPTGIAGCVTLQLVVLRQGFGRPLILSRRLLRQNRTLNAQAGTHL